MSRIGKQLIVVPDGVEIRLDGGTVAVKGSNGELSFRYPSKISVEFDSADKAIRVSRPNDQRQNRALHGMVRSLINNMVQGVQKHFEKRLEIVGVGYQARLNGSTLELQVGFANTVCLPIPAKVICEVPDNTHVVVKSIDKQAVGQFAAEIRRVRPPEPYKGKGIRFQGEHVRRKAGKTLAGG